MHIVLVVWRFLDFCFQDTILSAFLSLYISRSYQTVSAKSGSRNNNPSHMTENYLKVARSTFHEGIRIFFHFFFLTQDLDHVRPICHVLEYSLHWDESYSTLLLSNESDDP